MNRIGAIKKWWCGGRVAREVNGEFYWVNRLPFVQRVLTLKWLVRLIQAHRSRQFSKQHPQFVSTVKPMIDSAYSQPWFRELPESPERALRFKIAMLRDTRNRSFIEGLYTKK